MNCFSGIMIVLCLTFGGSEEESVTQTQGQVTLSERTALTVNCSYETAVYPGLFWYVQYPGEGPQLLLKATKDKEKGSNKGFEATYDRETGSFHLKKASVQASDSAVYYCALSDPGNTGKLIFGQGTSLQIKPVIENPEPAVYQLRDPKSRNTSVCLFTDFDSNVNLSESVLPGVPHTQPTVLNMKSLDSKSNAAVAWSSKSNFDCRNTFGDPTFYPSSDYPCNATLVEESFETDMNLNLENLSVMALRILLLKVAGFNLLMTLRLWSS